jgi:hypothetical protein
LSGLFAGHAVGAQHLFWKQAAPPAHAQVTV